MSTNIPTDLLRSFVAIVEAGSMAQATSTVFLTQSALSLQMKRLEDLLQQRLFRRHGRSLVLTGSGDELVGHARQLLGMNDRIVEALGRIGDPEPLQLGLVQDFADTLLPGVLARFHAAHPRARIQLRVGGSAELIELFDQNRLDIVLCIGRHDAIRRGDIRRGSSQVVREVAMSWIGETALSLREELPLVLLEQPCTFRTATIEALERVQRRYRIMLETPNLPGLRAAVRAGLGITCRTADFARAEALPVPNPDRLPPLPCIDYVLLRRNVPSKAGEALAGLLEAAA